MSLPTNVNELINGRIVEWARIEFKRGWNPDSGAKTITAFANDIDNLGGGYLVFGISEDAGSPVLPPTGLNKDKLDSIQRELVQICHRINPEYFPLVEPVYFQGKWLLIVCARSGPHKPYKAPDGNVYIRRFSVTKRASRQEEIELMELSKRIAYDDQLNQEASVDDLDKDLIRAFLESVGSDLTKDIDNMSLVDLGRKLGIIGGPDEDVLPKNVGLLFFCNDPNKYFKGSGIDIVEFEDDTMESFIEKKFRGPIDHQLKSALAYIGEKFIFEKVTKSQGKLETDRVFSYPIKAVKESLANAVFHRSYQNQVQPVEVRIFPNRMEILSYPGPTPPINKEQLRSKNEIIARRYRNSRIGDFLKELRLTEARGTGLKKIRSDMRRNNSPDPYFDTDDDRTFFLTILKAHPDTVEIPIKERRIFSGEIVKICHNPSTVTEIKNILDQVDSKTIRYLIRELVKSNLLAFTTPDEKTNEQRYLTTNNGEKFLAWLKREYEN